MASEEMNAESLTCIVCCETWLIDAQVMSPLHGRAVPRPLGPYRRRAAEEADQMLSANLMV